jgi:hypothetical protein
MCRHVVPICEQKFHISIARTGLLVVEKMALGRSASVIFVIVACVVEIKGAVVVGRGYPVFQVLPGQLAFIIITRVFLELVEARIGH